MPDVPLVRLGEVASVRSGFAFKSRDWTKKGVPVVKIANVKAGYLDMAVCSFVSENVAERSADFRLKEHDILISMTGYVGQVATVKASDLPALLNQRVGRFSIIDKMRLDERFLYFCVANPRFREKIEALGYGSAQPNVSPTAIHGIEISLPSLPEQKAITSVLGALDDKIELNRRMNETLESMARAIFKDWFVDFGPTRAKAEGRAPYLAPELWDLFPNSLDDEDKPVGWQEDVLGSFTNLQNGYAFKSKDWRNFGVPVVKIGSVKPAFVDLDQVSFVDEALALEKANFRLSTGDMLVGLTGYVGETGRIPPTQYTPILNQRVGRFLPNRGLESFVFSAVRRPEFKEFAKSKSHGSAQANVSTKDLLSYPLPNPGELIIKTFCDIASPMFKNSLANSGQTLTLSQTRDLLLPKLMSGEIRLSEAENMVETLA